MATKSRPAGPAKFGPPGLLLVAKSGPALPKTVLYLINELITIRAKCVLALLLEDNISRVLFAISEVPVYMLTRATYLIIEGD